MKFSQKILLASLGSASLAFGNIASGEVLLTNLDFGPAANTAAVGIAAFTGSSATATDVWNNRDSFDGGGANAPSTQALLGPDGTASGVSYFSASGQLGGGAGVGLGGAGFDGAFSNGSGPFTNPALDYVFANNVAATGTTIDGNAADVAFDFTLFDASGTTLDDEKLYDIYIFGGGDAAGQGGSFMLEQAGGTFLVESYTGSPVNTNPTTFTEGGANSNLVVFEDVSPTFFSATGLEFNFSGFAPLGSGDVLTINGIQLVEVPEPSSIALIGLGGLACLRRRRGA